MKSSRRLTDQERLQIVRERAKGVSVSAISAALNVSPKTVYNVLSRGRSAVSANDSRTRVLTMRVTEIPRTIRGVAATKPFARSTITKNGTSAPMLNRPAWVKERTVFGDWEGDLMIFRREHGLANVASLVERKTLYAVLFRNNDRSTRHLMTD